MRLNEIREGGKPDREEVWGSSSELYQCLEFWDLRKKSAKEIEKISLEGRRRAQKERHTGGEVENAWEKADYRFTNVEPCQRDLVMNRCVTWIVGIESCRRKIPAQWEERRLRQDSTYNYFSDFCCCKREQDNEAVDRGQDLSLGSSLVV